jgi:hypothetical protein
MLFVFEESEPLQRRFSAQGISELNLKKKKNF